MRRLIVIAAAAAALVASPAIACRGAHSETHVFLPALPKELDPSLVVLRVAPSASQTDERHVLEVRVVEAIQGEWDDATAVIDFTAFTSCSRAYLSAEGAYVVGRRSTLPTRLIARQYRRSEFTGKGQGE